MGDRAGTYFTGWKRKNRERNSADHNGMFLIKGLSDGRLNSAKPPERCLQLGSGNTYYYRIRGTILRELTGRIPPPTFSENTRCQHRHRNLQHQRAQTHLDSTGGRGGSCQLVTTSYTDASQNTITYTVAKYDFDRISIGDGASAN